MDKAPSVEGEDGVIWFGRGTEENQGSGKESGQRPKEPQAPSWTIKSALTDTLPTTSVAAAQNVAAWNKGSTSLCGV